MKTFLALSGRKTFFAVLIVSASLAQAQQQNAASESGSPVSEPTLPYSPSLDLTSMDKSADPCVDFYQYSCGGWQKNNPIPPDQTSWGVYGKLYQDNLGFLRGILEEAAKAKQRTARWIAEIERIGEALWRRVGSERRVRDALIVDTAGPRVKKPTSAKPRWRLVTHPQHPTFLLKWPPQRPQ